MWRLITIKSALRSGEHQFSFHISYSTLQNHLFIIEPAFNKVMSQGRPEAKKTDYSYFLPAQ
ncbi:hypothetical protein SAMN05444359_115119 [Neolewinella agarilytica]|uniref:Uncharacterized protein n=1 Tax=Neolewinella agarilytica TaxID=478744 RepID=A0A1H9ISK1_9BACT|nr:hypothetical protein SAMN05444359_115119 [Neolewinella agarilytica]